MTQQRLFDDSSNEQQPKANLLDESEWMAANTEGGKSTTLDRFQGALLLSTIGDALGWPTEFLKASSGRKPPFELPVHDFVEWKKLVGGRWWGYEEKITPGTYSDDTQLALAVARCITDDGEFEPERFAYEELPLWLQYEQGGGKSVKTAARKLIGKNAKWYQNFYKQGDLDYKQAGANGAAMRNLPIALVNINNEPKIIKDSFLNTIITHGHPRAILGAILFGLVVNFVLLSPDKVTLSRLIEYLRSHMRQIGKIAFQDVLLTEWIQRWEMDSKLFKEDNIFKNIFNGIYDEAFDYLEHIGFYLHKESSAYYDFVGALKPATKGSGLATVCVAIYLFLKYIDEPQEALITAANMLGSDTDTIGVFLGALLGAYYGLNGVPEHLAEKVQDREYLLKIANRLYSIATGRKQDVVAIKETVVRRDAYFKILAWEINLHDMFWDIHEADMIIYHPTLGRGQVEVKVEKPVKRDDYTAKLIYVQFDSGQSCVFHSRVQNNEKVSESLAQDVVSALHDML